MFYLLVHLRDKQVHRNDADRHRATPAAQGPSFPSFLPNRRVRAFRFSMDVMGASSSALTCAANSRAAAPHALALVQLDAKVTRVSSVRPA